MAIDSTLRVRRAILTLLKADAGVTAIVPPARVYPQVTSASSAWPFIRYGAPTVLPRKASCVDGSSLAVAIHGFAKARMSGTVEVETAEDYAGRLGEAIAAALDGQKANVPDGRIAIDWTGSQLLVDGAEAGAFHTVQNFRIRVLTA